MEDRVLNPESSTSPEARQKGMPSNQRTTDATGLEATKSSLPGVNPVMLQLGQLPDPAGVFRHVHSDSGLTPEETSPESCSSPYSRRQKYVRAFPGG